jgi:hypothetical protein
MASVIRPILIGTFIIAAWSVPAVAQAPALARAVTRAFIGESAALNGATRAMRAAPVARELEKCASKRFTG